jgi:acyl-CoA synthetase (AMP-forming)/AMP-acid ligase II
VYPAEIEQVLMRLDGVADAAVIGVADERLGEVGKAYIVRRPGATLDVQSVIDYSAKHVANFKKPRFVEFLDELPRNLGGKVVKPTLRAMHQQESS